ncbi:hypothetical protein Goshw_016967 [Gossypium schwendimanii]|uniref:Uncharacterized protein n=1 Tax=Gossypium schwendimanii TaxID=34291 RepID=A0A7J9LY44_GOSSC|nr:hypothetical protein [Gossypium schwendimanii]
MNRNLLSKGKLDNEFGSSSSSSWKPSAFVLRSRTDSRIDVVTRKSRCPDDVKNDVPTRDIRRCDVVSIPLKENIDTLVSVSMLMDLERELDHLLATHTVCLFVCVYVRLLDMPPKRVNVRASSQDLFICVWFMLLGNPRIKIRKLGLWIFLSNDQFLYSWKKRKNRGEKYDKEEQVEEGEEKEMAKPAAIENPTEEVEVKEEEE